jgi:hypothetical protein
VSGEEDVNMVKLAVVLKEGRGSHTIVYGLEEGPSSRAVGGQPLYEGEIALYGPCRDESVDGVGDLSDEYHRAHQDGVLSLAWWESHYEVHGDLLEWECILWDCDAIQGYAWAMRIDFVLLACCTSLDVVSDPCVHASPLRDRMGLPYCFISSWVSRCSMVVHPVH